MGLTLRPTRCSAHRKPGPQCLSFCARPATPSFLFFPPARRRREGAQRPASRRHACRTNGLILISAAAWRPGDAGRSGNPAPRADRTVFGQFHQAATAQAGYHPHKAIRGVARRWSAGGLPPRCQRAARFLAPLPALKAGGTVMLFPAPE